MREIKFRAWNPKKGLMVLLTKLKWSDGVVYVDEQDGFHPSHLDCNPVMQYIGLKDKNGKEIYEGDVVKVLYTDWPSCQDCHSTPQEHMDSLARTATVVWSNESLSYKLQESDGYDGKLFTGPHGFIRIIGNIYENPELLAK